MSKDEVGTDAAEAATAGAPALLPCPFCGGRDVCAGILDSLVWCRNSDCGAVMDDRNGVPASALWNRRAAAVEVADRQARSAVAPDPAVPPSVSKE